MFIEIFRLMFGGRSGERGRGSWWWFVLFCGAASLALGLWAAAGAFEGDYPWHQGRVFVAVMLLWTAVLVFRTRLDWRPAMPAPVAFVVRWFNHALTLAMLYVPGLAVLWYSLEARDSPSVNSRGQDVCSTSASQYCVSGPRALIPWAIILLVFAFAASWFFIWKWSTNGGRKSRLVKPVYDIADSVRRVEAVIPPNDPGATGSQGQTGEASDAATELMSTVLRRGSLMSLVNTLGKIATAPADQATQQAPDATLTPSGPASATVSTPQSSAPSSDATPQEWPPRRVPERELNAFAHIPRPDTPAPGQSRRDATTDSSPLEAAEEAPSDPNEAVHALGELVQMHRAGEITDAEFDAMKARLIGGTSSAG